MSREIASLAARCEELYRHYQDVDRRAAAAERHRQYEDAAKLRLQARAWHADYEMAVGDLRRAT